MVFRECVNMSINSKMKIGKFIFHINPDKDYLIRRQTYEHK